MPIYEYRCTECQQVFEEWCKHVNDGMASRTCPICKGKANRLISNTTFALKGGGWYVTEYGSRKKNATPDGAAQPASGKAAVPAPTEGSRQNAPAAEARG
jgi:putative FmdB family regulatory protein